MCFHEPIAVEIYDKTISFIFNDLMASFAKVSIRTGPARQPPHAYITVLSLSQAVA
jgi:hypothetical protein